MLGVAAGALFHRADYCLVAALRDPFLFGDRVLTRTLVVGIAVTALLFEALRAAGLLSAYPFPLLGPAHLAGAAGGVLFGVGMVLAGGCVVGTLYKVAQGRGLHLAAFLGILGGSGLYAEFHPFWTRVAAPTRVGGDAVTLPQALGLPPWALVLPLTAALLGWAWRWWRRGELSRPFSVPGGVSPLAAALSLSGISAAVCAVSGVPIGVTTAYTKLAAAAESWLAPAHVAANEFFRAAPLSFRLAWADLPLVGGPGPRWDGVALLQGPIIAGILAGAGLSARLAGEWRLRLRAPARQYVSAIVGGGLMGIGARMGAGCNVWHLWGGVPILALQSLVFVAGLLPGTWLGTRILVSWVVLSNPAAARAQEASP
ncbi:MULTISPECIES: YeeE/YedE family protein [Deferrisoma]